MTGSPTVPDPVRERRAQVAKWVLLANRVGYLFWAVALAVFFIGFSVGFHTVVSVTVITTLLIGAALLAPAIILGYAVKAAEKDDRINGR
ncbi:MAG: hypothetical protein WCH93_01790 [Actinomycetota bacterium]